MVQYLDYNASTPVDSEVLDYMMSVYQNFAGNADSRTHSHGTSAREVVESARSNLADLLKIDASEIIFTSGATESSNTAILGLEDLGRQNGKTHIITTAIEHKATLEPIRQLEKKGFSADYILPEKTGVISAAKLLSRITDKTLLVSVQHVNNETGAIQPVKQIGDYCRLNNIFFHVDAAQSLGKLVDELRDVRYDLLSATAHKMYGPQGVGILVMRRKGYKKPPVMPRSFGGGQENSFRPGTLPVALIAGFGRAAELALAHHNEWREHSKRLRESVLSTLKESDIHYKINGDVVDCVDSTLNISFIGVNSEALMIAARPYFSLANGSACTSKEYKHSYVLEAMGVSDEVAESSIRISWGKDTKNIDMNQLIDIVKNFLN
ncbi:putative L-cysteine desulfurase [Clostridia bacterium]|nr:putative L-cysteine desulfurase [Clostridia bacterium]